MSAHFVPDQQRTIRRLIDALAEEKRPIHYREAYGRFLEIECGYKSRSERTDGSEKLRQWFSESNRAVFVCDGFLYLSDWLSESKSLLFRESCPANTLTIEERDDCFYECGRRHEHMLDKYGHANTRKGIADRQRRFLIEHSVAAYFRDKFSMFYLDPTNKFNYDRPANHDFRMKIGANKIISFDVKEFTRSQTTVLTNADSEVTYIFAKWRDSFAEMIGFLRGRDADILPVINTRYTHAREAEINDLSGIASLIVAINMHKLGMSFNAVKARYNAKAIA